MAPETYPYVFLNHEPASTVHLPLHPPFLKFLAERNGPGFEATHQLYIESLFAKDLDISKPLFTYYVEFLFKMAEETIETFDYHCSDAHAFFLEKLFSYDVQDYFFLHTLYLETLFKASDYTNSYYSRLYIKFMFAL